MTGCSVLFMARMVAQSGNDSTIKRIKSHFHSEYKCHARDTDSFGDTQEFLDFLEDEHINAVIGIHALHAGKWLKDSPVPFALILGGTDLNEYNKDAAKLKVMTSAVDKARYIITFSEAMSLKARDIWPLTSERPRLFRVIAQAIKTHPGAGAFSELRNRFGLARDSQFLCMVGGIRPVKDPLFLIPAFSEWHRTKRRDVFMLVIGPVREDEYGDRVLELVQKSEGVIFLGGRDMEETHAIIKDSLALVNSSTSEGMATAILEAMELETPVIARDIPGNRALVCHEKTGLLYSTPQEFLGHLDRLLLDQNLAATIVRHAKEQVKHCHGCEEEQKAYATIIRDLCTV